MKLTATALLLSPAILQAAGPELAPIDVREFRAAAPAEAGGAVESPSLREVRKKMAELGIAYPAVIAHRGASAYAPEESAPALQCAVEQGADYIELDLHLTRDGVLVLNHDADFSKTTDVARKFPAKARALIGEFDWSEVRQLDSSVHFRGSTAGPCWNGKATAVLRLEDALRIARATKGRSPGVYLEAKFPDSHPEYAAPVAEAIVKALKAAGWISGANDGRKVIFESFSLEAIDRFKALAPSVPATYLYSPGFLGLRARDPLPDARAHRADIIGPKLSAASGSFIEKAHAAGLAVHPWTVDDARAMNYLLAAGADGFFTNRPDEARRR